MRRSLETRAEKASAEVFPRLTRALLELFKLGERIGLGCQRGTVGLPPHIFDGAVAEKSGRQFLVPEVSYTPAFLQPLVDSLPFFVHPGDCRQRGQKITPRIILLCRNTTR